MAAVRVARAALLLAGVTSGLRRHRQSRSDEASNATSSSCNAPDALYGLVRRIANRIISSQVAPLDPLHLDIPDVEKELNLPGCNLGVKLDMNLDLAGFGDAEVGEVACSNSECVEDGLLGTCKTEVFDMEIGVAFGEIIALKGWSIADWKLCWREMNDRRVEVGVDVLSPGINSKIQVEYARGLVPRAKILQVYDLGLDMGTPQNFACGFKSLPNFVGSVLERWCTRIGGWLLDKTHSTVNTKINSALTKLVNQIFDVEPEE